MPTPGTRPSRRSAFTLIEILAVMAIILLLSTILLQVAKVAKLKGQTTKAKSEIEGYMSTCTRFRTERGHYPDHTKGELAVGTDPWNRAYRYRLYTYPADIDNPTNAAPPDELQYVFGSFGPDGAPGVKGYDDDDNDADNIYKKKWNSKIKGADNTLWSEFGYGDDIVMGDAPMYKRFFPE